jgi:hypothetical protein
MTPAKFAQDPSPKSAGPKRKKKKLKITQHPPNKHCPCPLCKNIYGKIKPNINPYIPYTKIPQEDNNANIRPKTQRSTKKKTM